MLYGDKEITLIKALQDDIETEKAIILPKVSKKTKNIFELISDKTNWENWINSSGKDDPPPDFYSDKYRIMMDVMRVDDHERTGNRGKLFNPVRQRERMLHKEITDKLGISPDSNVEIHINAYTGLSSYEDHNYTLYKNNFRRVIKKHIDSIPLYKKNHPGYKTVFFVFDESEAYYQSNVDIDKERQRFPGQIFQGEPHLFYMDSAFLNAFIGSKIDYLIWYTPYKLINTLEAHPQIPKICVFDLSQNRFKEIKYREDRMESVEV